MVKAKADAVPNLEFKIKVIREQGCNACRLLMNTTNLPKTVDKAKDAVSLTTQKRMTLGGSDGKTTLQDKVLGKSDVKTIPKSNSCETETKSDAAVAKRAESQKEDGFSMELLKPGQGHHIIIAPAKGSSDKSNSPTRAQGHSPRLRLSRKKSPQNDTLKPAIEATIPRPNSAKESLKRKSDVGLDGEHSSKRPKESDSSLKSNSLVSNRNATDSSVDHSSSIDSSSSSKMLTRSMNRSLSQESETQETTESHKEDQCSKSKSTNNSKLLQSSLPKGE